MATKLGSNGLPAGQGFYWKGETIYVAIWKDGKKQTYCTRTDDWKAAVNFRAEKMTAKNESAATIQHGVRMTKVFDDYVAHLESNETSNGMYMRRLNDKPSYKTHKRINKHLVPAFGKLKPEEITTELLNAYRSRRNREAGSVATVNSELRLLRAALKLGAQSTPPTVDSQNLPSFKNIIRDEAEKKLARTGTITDEQYHKILDALAKHLKPVFVTAYWTGIRAKELKFVRRSNVNFSENIITLNASEIKAGDLRVAPMNDEVKAALMKWEDFTAANFPRTPWLFHLQGEQIGSWKTGWNAALKRCGLRVHVFNPDGSPKMRIAKNGKRVKTWKNLVTFHDTRRTMITRLDEAGIDERDTMKVGGHSTPSINRRFNQSKQAAERVRIAQNKMLGLGVTELAPSAPAASTGRRN